MLISFYNIILVSAFLCFCRCSGNSSLMMLYGIYRSRGVDFVQVPVGTSKVFSSPINMAISRYFIPLTYLTIFSDFLFRGFDKLSLNLLICFLSYINIGQALFFTFLLVCFSLLITYFPQLFNFIRPPIYCNNIYCKYKGNR